MSEKVKLTIIGGGVIGCALAYQLSQKYDEIFVIEKNDKIKAENQSSRNSGVIHAGVYYPKDIGALKGQLCIEGNKLLYEFCEEFDVPHKKVGKLIVATNEQELEYLKDSFDIAVDRGVPGAKKITPQEAQKIEPNISCIQAAYFPTSGVVEPTSLVYKLYSLAAQNGVFFLTGTKVIDIKPKEKSFEVITESRGNKEAFETELLINAAGLYSDEIAKIINPDFPYTIKPIRGEAVKFYKSKRPELFHAGMNVYPVPFPIYPSGERANVPFKEFKKLFQQEEVLKTVGIHLTPTFDFLDGTYKIGNVVTIGPAPKGVIDKEDYSKDLFPEEYFLKHIQDIFPGLKLEDVSLHQAGVQAKLQQKYDFVIERETKYPNCFNLVGIDSPGLTACLSIAKHVNEMLKENLS